MSETNGAETEELRPSGAVFAARLAGLWPWLVVAALTWLGWHEVRKIDVSAVREILRSTDSGVLLTLLIVSAINLAVFGLYDVAALGPASRPPARGARWAVGVVSFAWSNFLTVGPLAGPALRLWLYRPLGVERQRARAALTAILTSFSLALVVWCGAASIPLPGPLDSGFARIALAIPAMGLVAAALRWIPRWRLAPPSVREWEGKPLALAAVSGFDWLVAWVVFHLALSGLHGGIKVGHSLQAFFLGQLIGLVSFIPGGLGSADAFWLLSLSAESGGHDHVLAALILYRSVYYVLPWAAASLVLAGRLVPAGRRTGAFLRTAIASYTFLCGAILLVSAATPGLADRVAFLRDTVPLPLVEVSHGISIALGFLLLVISRGLARGYRGSHRLALGFFLAASLTTFLKGLDFEEALLALVAVVLLLVFHRAFAREGRLAPPAEFLISIAAFAIVLFAAVGFGSMSDLPELPAGFGRFEVLAHEARFLRGLVLLTFIAGIAGLHLRLRARAADRLPDGTEIARAVVDVRAWSATTNSLLVACGDKEIFRTPVSPDGPAPAGFIPYRTAGRFLVAYSDPVCPPGAERDLLAAFMEHAASADRDVILYQISAGFLPVAHDFGFTFFKLGEEAIVDLTRFDLKGNKAKTWRHAINLVEKAGGSFEIVEPADLDSLLPELKAVSDEWLADKHLAEKRFSIGRFSEPYMRRFPCAIVRDGPGRVVAFANILAGGPGGELSIDLMRHSVERERAAGMKDAMDYLFLKLMLHGKLSGYARFNLGMAPLAAVGEQRWARPMERLAHLFFRHGEQWYNYQGLRHFKEKFDPVWEPRYMGYPRPWDWPLAVASTAVLIAGGWRALVTHKGAEG